MIPKPRYPIYIPSKNRADHCYTAQLFIQDGVPFKIVVEPSQYDAYARNFGEEHLLVLPEDNMRLLGARLWIREHSIQQGYERHWQFDDNITHMYRLHKGKRIPVNANIGICAVEDFTDRYTNIGLSGFNYEMFVMDYQTKPFFLNVHVYSATLVWNKMPYKWRLYYNDDTDLCLQVLTNKLCTVLFNAFCVKKIRTMKVKGGNTDDLYQGDGRLRMARTLQELWPEHVKVIWRFGRPQHYVDWSKFKHRLKRRTDIDWDKIPKVNNYGMKLKVLREPKGELVRKIYETEKERGNVIE